MYKRSFFKKPFLKVMENKPVFLLHFHINSCKKNPGDLQNPIKNKQTANKGNYHILSLKKTKSKGQVIWQYFIQMDWKNSEIYLHNLQFWTDFHHLKATYFFKWFGKNKTLHSPGRETPSCRLFTPHGQKIDNIGHKATSGGLQNISPPSLRMMFHS